MNPSAGVSSKENWSLTFFRDVIQESEEFFRKNHMTYGFRDDPNVSSESVALMEDIVVEYVTDLVHKEQDIGSKRGKLLVEDFLYLIRKDFPKLTRSTELLSMNEELKQARKAIETDEEKLRKAFEADEDQKLGSTE